jgi:hypothetical protein
MTFLYCRSPLPCCLEVGSVIRELVFHDFHPSNHCRWRCARRRDRRFRAKFLKLMGEAGHERCCKHQVGSERLHHFRLRVNPNSRRRSGDGIAVVGFCGFRTSPGNLLFDTLSELLRRPQHGRSVAIEGQLQDIAAEIGMTREALDRTLAALEAEGSVTRKGAAIVLKKSVLT